jgi:hypothetical protein
MSVRKQNIFKPGNKALYPLSRTKLENFLGCPRCFYIDRRLGVSPPNGPPFNINIAVDLLLKREFDGYRASQTAHPYMKETERNLVPFADSRLDVWRDNRKGVRVEHSGSGFSFFGAIDDLWFDLDTQEVIVVDYKATSKDSAINLDADWQVVYKRQMEIYQWLLRSNGLKVSSTGYFVYCNGRRDNDSFDGCIKFDVHILSYQGDDSWVEGSLVEASACLNADKIPPRSVECSQCGYLESYMQVTR